MQPKRRFVKEGLLLVLRGQKKSKQYEKYHVFLFSDILVLSTPKQGEKGVECQYAETIRLEVISELSENKCECCLFGISNLLADKGAFDVFFFGSQESKFTFCTNTKVEKGDRT